LSKKFSHFRIPKSHKVAMPARALA